MKKWTPEQQTRFDYKHSDEYLALKRQEQKDRLAQRRLAKIAKDPDYLRRTMLMKKYGISLEDYNLLLQKQKGYCAICGEHQSRLVKTLAVDHDHATGKIRELLCHRCNMVLGSIKDDPELLQKLIAYLHKHT